MYLRNLCKAKLTKNGKIIYESMFNDDDLEIEDEDEEGEETDEETSEESESNEEDEVEDEVDEETDEEDVNNYDDFINRTSGTKKDDNKNDEETEETTWWDDFKNKLISIVGADETVDTLTEIDKEKCINLLQSKNDKIKEIFIENNDNLDRETLSAKLQNLEGILATAKYRINDLCNQIIKKFNIIEEDDGPSYQKELELKEEILVHKKDINRIMITYPGRNSGFSPYGSPKKSGSKDKRLNLQKSLTIKNLNSVLERAMKESPESIEELKSEHFEYSNEIMLLMKEINKLKEQEEQLFDKGKIEESKRIHYEWIELSRQAIEKFNEFKEKYDPKKKKKPLEESEFRDQLWYSRVYNEYALEVAMLPGVPFSIDESLKNLTERKKFLSSSAKYPDFKNVIEDKSLINQVVRGVKPIAHTKSFRKDIKIDKEESKQIAYVIAPSRMGGGAIWYKPSQTSGERPYDERILGLNPQADKEDRSSTKPYNPLSRDANLEIVRLYMWNNLANGSDPKLYNFINGLCLGYPRDYIIWFCESKYGQIDNRHPERSFWGTMIDRFKYCLNAGVNGYGRPGSIQPDGMFSKMFKSLTPQFFNDWINKILGTSDVVEDPFKNVVDEFNPVRAPEKPEFEESIENKDPIIETIFSKLDNLYFKSDV